MATVAGLHLCVSGEIGAEVAMAQHDAFGQAGGAAGVNHCCPVVGLDFAFAAFYLTHPFVAIGDA